MKKTVFNTAYLRLINGILVGLDSSFCCLRPAHSLINVRVLIRVFLKTYLAVVCLMFLSCGHSNPPLAPPPAHGGLDQLLTTLDNIKSPSSINWDSFSTMTHQINVQQSLYNKSVEQLRAELLAPVQESERQDFYSELQSIWNVGEHQAFFKRQIAYCQSKMDLALVGIGIIRVDEVLKGENPAVLAKDQTEFIKYVREQVQQAIASKDKNYKAIVFKGLESSAS